MLVTGQLSSIDEWEMGDAVVTWMELCRIWKVMFSMVTRILEVILKKIPSVLCYLLNVLCKPIPYEGMSFGLYMFSTSTSLSGPHYKHIVQFASNAHN